MTGPSERKLEKVLSADPGQVRGAGRAWQVAAEGLQQVADALDSAQGDLADAWQGRDATAATAAFSTLGGSVRANQGRMQTAAEAMDGAAEALAAAQRAHASLPSVPPEPTFPEAGDDGQVSTDQEIRYIKLLGVHRSAANEREAQAEAAYQTLVTAMGDSSDQLGAAAPESTERTWGNTPTATTPTTATPGTTTTSTGLPVLGGGGGTVSGSGGGGTAHAVGTGATGFVGSVHHPTDVTSTTTSGVVGGTSTTSTTSTAPLGQGHVAPAPVEIVGEGSSGGIAAAGVLGGAGGALGAARAAAGGRLSPAIGRVVGAGTTAAGAARPGVTGATARTPLGGTARATGSSVLGATGRTGATTGTTGTVGAARSAAGSTAAATRGGTTPVGGGTQGAAGGAGRGAATSGGSGGRYSAPPSTRGGAGQAATGSRPSGAAPGGRGAGGAGAMGRGGAGGTQDERAERRPSMLIDDEDAWIDDDDSNPGVIR